MKKTISYDEYLKLLGLLTLGEEHERQMRELVDAAGKIVGDDDPHTGHTGEAIYAVGPYTARDRAERLLKRLEVSVDPIEF